jgi:sigma-B regulation protein RsbU (phosphoserine phosphatase)
MTARFRSRWPYLLLLLTAIFTVIPQLRISWSTARILLDPGSVVQPLFSLDTPQPLVRKPLQSAAAAGIRAGDLLLAVNGGPIRGFAGLYGPLAASRPGQTLVFRVRRQGAELDIPIRLSAYEPVSFADAIFPLVRDFGIPFFCMALGFGVAFIRPRDPMAWLLLGLMLCFSCMIDTGLNLRAAAWEEGYRDIAAFVRSFLSQMWGPAMMLFGIYFPERLQRDRAQPWLKWLLLAPALFIGVTVGLYYVAAIEDFTLAARFEALDRSLGSAPFWLHMASCSLFFACIWYKIHLLTGDARRRLRLLVVGTSVAMTPLLPIVVVANLTGKDAGTLVPLWVIATAVGMLMLFPLTMAYVIVVERALDVRVVVRQGMRYALATRGVRVLQGIITAAVILYAVRVLSSGGLRRPQLLTYASLAVIAVVLARRAADALKLWVDKRFFREAYSAEQVLVSLGDKVRTIVERTNLMETVAGHVADSLHIAQVAVLLREGDRYRVSHSIGYPGAITAAFPSSGAVVSHLRTTQKPARVYFDDDNSWLRRAGVSVEETRPLQELDTQLLVPLAFQDRLPGILSLGRKLSDEPYSNSDINLLASVAGHTGLALENSSLTAEVANEVARRELLRREVAIAREVQQRLFPQRFPAVPGITYTGACRPASEVGGDYYDFLELEDGRFGFAIGDVSGKGIPAALLMASLQASLRGQAISGPKSLAELMANVNRLLYDASPRSHFATLFYGSYHPATRCLSYVNAGHNAPMLVRRNGQGPEVIRLDGHGLGAGLTRAAHYTECSRQLQPGDMLVAFTDGISEAMDAAGLEWGEDGLAAVLPAFTGQSVHQILDSVLQAAQAHASGAPQHDDMTLVVLSVDQ